MAGAGVFEIDLGDVEIQRQSDDSDDALDIGEVIY